MVNSRFVDLGPTFAALADPTRRAIVERLARGERTVAELAAPFPISAPAISKHLRILERAGLVVQRREGRTRRCRLTVEPIRRAESWIERHLEFWNATLDSLAEFVEKDPTDSEKHKKKR